MVDVRDSLLKSPVGSLCDIAVAHATDRIISPSARIAGLIRSYCFVNQEKISVIPNGIDPDAFDKIKEYDAHTVLTKYDLKTDNYLLFVGRLSIFKGVQYLIEAFKDVKKRHPNLKLVIVGTGDFERYLKRLALGISGIIFTGKVDSMVVKKILYENSLFVCVPSLFEAFPMVVLEAMACGRAVVVSNVGDVRLMVRHGENGFLVNPGDSTDLSRSIAALCEDESMRKSMGLFGRELLEKEFTSEKMVDRTLKLYDSLC
jgi:glycosyltransferase involved in cell wall biosynthesis